MFYTNIAAKERNTLYTILLLAVAEIARTQVHKRTSKDLSG